jgi:hypothetical protein
MRFFLQTPAIIVVFVVWHGALFAAPAARANPLAKPAAAEARNHLVLGNKLYGVRSFDEAAAEYKAGALVEPAPVFDYNLGQCFRQLGKYQEAIWHYERFLTRGNPQGELLDAVNGFIAQMKSELEKRAMTQKPTEPAPSPAAPAVSGTTQRSLVRRRHRLGRGSGGRPRPGGRRGLPPHRDEPARQREREPGSAGKCADA